MYSWTHFDHSIIPNTPENSPELAQPTLQRKHDGNFQTDFAISQRQYLLKLISISLVWIHAAHVMCSWTFGPFHHLKHTQNSPESNHHTLSLFNPYTLMFFVVFYFYPFILMR